MNKQDKKMDELLKNVMRTEEKPNLNLHRNIMNIWDEREEKNKRFRKKNIFKPVVAAICAAIILIGGTGTYAATHNMTISELFSDIWKTKEAEPEIISKLDSNFEVLEEKNTNTNLNIKVRAFFADRSRLYVIFKVTGKNGFKLPKNLAISSPSITDEQLLKYNISTERNRILKRIDNTIYYAYTSDGVYNGDVVFELGLTDFVHGEYDKEHNLSFDGERREKNNSDRFVNDGTYQVKIKTTADKRQKSLYVKGHKVTVSTLSVTSDYGFAKMYYKYQNEYYEKTGKNDSGYMQLLMKNGKKSSFSICSELTKKQTRVKYGNEENKGYSLMDIEGPFDIDDIKGISVGGKEYYFDR